MRGGYGRGGAFSYTKGQISSVDAAETSDLGVDIIETH